MNGNDFVRRRKNLPILKQIDTISVIKQDDSDEKNCSRTTIPKQIWKNSSLTLSDFDHQ